MTFTFFHLLFDTIGIWMQQIQILKVPICCYLLHLSYIVYNNWTLHSCAINFQRWYIKHSWILLGIFKRFWWYQYFCNSPRNTWCTKIIKSFREVQIIRYFWHTFIIKFGQSNVVQLMSEIWGTNLCTSGTWCRYYSLYNMFVLI